jgi:release factor glutamine methyltransferase
MSSGATGNESPVSAEGLLRDVQERLRDGGTEDWRLEARWILEDVTGSDYSRIIAGLADVPTRSQTQKALELTQARLEGEPLAHVLGYTEFYGLRFRLARGVMVPRRETETLVDAALGLMDSHDWAEPRVLDCYAGCGNILLSIMARRPGVRGVGIEIDPEALACAEANKKSLGREDAIFILGDVFEELGRIDRKFHLVTANPPYVCSGDIESLQREISAHERRWALDGGRNGMDHYRVLAAKTPSALVPGGFLLAEIGIGRREAIAEVFAEWGELDFQLDLSGHPRALVARA